MLVPEEMVTTTAIYPVLTVAQAVVPNSFQALCRLALTTTPLLPHFTDEEAEAQRTYITYSRSYGQ